MPSHKKLALGTRSWGWCFTFQHVKTTTPLWFHIVLEESLRGEKRSLHAGLNLTKRKLHDSPPRHKYHCHFGIKKFDVGKLLASSKISSLLWPSDGKTARKIWFLVFKFLKRLYYTYILLFFSVGFILWLLCVSQNYHGINCALFSPCL